MCPANGELENGDPEAPVDFLCHVAHLRAKAMGIPVPSALLTAVPYVLTIIVITIFAGTASYPAAMNQPYLRRAKRAPLSTAGVSADSDVAAPVTASSQSATDRIAVSALQTSKGTRP